MSVYCQFYDNKQNIISEITVSGVDTPIPTGAVSGLFYDNTYKMTGINLTFSTETFVFNFSSSKDYFLYIFPENSSYVLANSVRSEILMSDVPELSQNDIDYLKNLSDNSMIDFTSIVTALNSITTALSALTNLSDLSNLSQLANIIIAISNKDNQSNIVDELRYIFTQSVNENTYRLVGNKQNLSVLKGSVTNIPDLATVGRSSLWYRFTNISNKLSVVNDNVANNESTNLNNKFLARLLTFSSIVGNSGTTANNFVTNSNLNNSLLSISDRLQNIETKLEQNLPFTTIVNNDYIDNCVSASVAYNKKIENIPFN